MVKEIIIANKRDLEEKKRSVLEQGAKKFHVLSDFDRTLTKAFVDGESTPSIISELRKGDYISKDYAKKAQALADKYHAIELDPNVPEREKKQKMYEWWTKHFDLLIKSGLNKKHLEQIIEKGKIQFRKGALEFLDFLHDNNIPLIILSSAGLGGDSISMFLDRQDKLYENIYIISNSYEWDSRGNAVRVKKPIIHSMNKDETIIQDYPVFERIRGRINVLLLGDSIGDVGMIHGFEYNILIKIGFLNENIEQNLDYYKKNFDVVILNDGSMDYVNKLLKEIVK